VYYAATWLEARLCAGTDVVVVGGGNSAGQATLLLAEHAPKVHLVIRHDDLGRDMSRYLVARIERLPNVEVWRRCEVCDLVGEGALEAVVVEDARTGDRRRIAATALFVFIGADPNTDWLRDVLTCAAGRSSGWPRPSARARWRCVWCTSTSPTATVGPRGDSQIVRQVCPGRRSAPASPGPWPPAG
jgi:hypothetical protein